jgi:hypothetical protein
LRDHEGRIKSITIGEVVVMITIERTVRTVESDEPNTSIEEKNLVTTNLQRALRWVPVPLLPLDWLRKE